jgi:phosphoglycerol transferase MdoB-like AlkP superfamily enzyme
MLLKLRLPKTLHWVINLMVVFLLMFTLQRFITFIVFKTDGKLLSDHLPSFFLGLRYDLRWISFILLPLVVASFFQELSPFYSTRTKKFWTWYLAIATFFIFFFFAADFGCFSYNKTRLNASALNFAEDPGISAAMLWQSYPILWMVAGLVLSVLLIRNMFRKLHGQVLLKTQGKAIPYDRKWFLVTALFLAMMAYGSTGSQPLKWNAAFTYNDSFKSYLALNPLQNFFSTLKFRKPQFSESKAKELYPVIAEYLDLNNNNFSYERVIHASSNSLTSRPNIVLVLCESFSMYKSSLSGNELNTTPFFQSIADSSIFFNRCFTPHFSTARGLFATLTGIPDVQLSKFSSRNPQALNQHTIINNFKGYQKFYFLGGSPSFNNFEGLVKNINGVNLVTEGKFKSKPVNVWGISDMDLFREANNVFSQQKDPFFAIIQTADNHRPFTIPQADTEFEKKTPLPAELEKWGFETVEEYNAFRYFDFSVKHFIEAAKSESYFKNTIFVFVGDHGVSGNAKAIYPAVWTDERLTEEHVPLIIYAPRLLKPQKRSEVVSQIDVLPTIAGIAGETYLNTTLGRDVLQNKSNQHYAFTIAHDEGRIGIISDDFYFTKNLNFQKEELHCLNEKTHYNKYQLDSTQRKMAELATAYYETAKYMLINNKPVGPMKHARVPINSY